MISIEQRVRAGFTLIELMVVVAMIAMIVASLTSAVAASRERARIEKARAEVKGLSQAILAYENYAKGHELPVMSDAEVSASSLDFLLGQKTADSGRIPVLMAAQLSAGGKVNDPWGHPYTLTIRKGNINLSTSGALRNLKTGFYLPNGNRLSAEERK